MKIVTDAKHQLKNLQTQKSNLETEISEINTQLETVKKNLNIKKSLLGEVNERIKSMTNNSSKMVVSEHAILRYLERVKGLNLAELEKEMMTDGIMNLVGKLGGNGVYPGDGYQVVMKNNVVVTVTK